MTSKNQPAKPCTRPEPNLTAGVIRADEVYVFEEACRRLQWRKHSAREARRLGLRPVKFGSRLYIRGSTVLAWFEKLAQQQNKDNP